MGDFNSASFYGDVVQDLRGPPGEPGKQGDQGDPGPRGEPGRDAIDGIDGKDGRDGTDAPYRYGGFAAADIRSSEVLMDHVVTRAHILAPSFERSKASVGKAPTGASWFASVQLNGSEIGRLTVTGTNAVLTTLSASPIPVAIGDVVSVVAQAAEDVGIARLRFTFDGEMGEAA